MVCAQLGKPVRTGEGGFETRRQEQQTKLPLAGVSQGHTTFSDFSFLHSAVNGYAFLYTCYSLYAIEMVVKL